MHWILAGLVSVLVIGDSHTKGVVDGGGPSFVDILRERLGTDYEVSTAVCPGSTSLDWIRRMELEQCWWGGRAYARLAAPKLPADVVVVLLGTNDAIGNAEPAPVEPERYAGAMRRLVDALAEDGAGRIVLLTPPPLAKPEDQARTEAYAEALRALAAQRAGVQLGPDLLLELDRDIHFAATRIHMNAAGHRVVGESLARFLRGASQAKPPEAPAP